ncbi:D-TA family PLP-dependent enzyme [Shinella sp. CPCC 101442]|uniref:D-TA family PLP-dependent enzyme n=1 Tax=Shinella sp. CPCC 101442 TaxID=2932265 RepID=UPI00215286FC|nr:D-TA family PLP-dependent enzyme [Shinella sp. CPCC 101442]MCR6501305.1 D-TA family PLP-dependent enzyme [Shinella sp. CPCC 101442]
MSDEPLKLPMAGTLRWRDVVETPAVLIDLDIVERNIKRCQDQCNRLGVAIRPHIKTHKLPLLAHAQLAAGAIGITAQKIGEAEIMADAGIEDILITFNIVGDRKLERLKRLAERSRISVVADSAAVVEGLARTFANEEREIGVLVECDTGMHRCGVLTSESALELARLISESPGLRFAGLMTYPAPGQGNTACEWLDHAACLIRAAGIETPIVSSGGTPDLYAMKHHPVLTEYRPGSYIYNDRSLVTAGACGVEGCALTVLTTVISSPEHGRAIVDAGTKVLTSDLFGMSGYGLVLDHPDWTVISLNEEHGRIEYAGGPAPVVGDLLRIIPNHACVVSNMVDSVHLVRGEHYVRAERVAARGRVT